jgi:hypothetical protein
MLRAAAILTSLLLLQTDAMALAVRRAPDSSPQLAQPAFFAAQKTDERKPGPATLEEAIEIAVKRFGGKAAGAETVERNGRRVHEVRVLLDDGSVRTVRIDPQTGAIIPQKR